MLHAENLKGFLIFLVVAGIIVPLFHRARVGTVFGFLVAGTVLGPHGLGRLAETYPWLTHLTFDHPQRAEPLGELGIIFLLFMIGIELSMQRLWDLRRYVLGIGAVQVAVSSVAIGLLVRAWGEPHPVGIVLGLCLALSSTAIVMQVLAEQRRSATRVARIALSVLLFQDLMVVPILIIVNALSTHSDNVPLTLTIAILQAVAMVAAIMVAGRYFVRPLMRSAARTGSRELLVAITLLIVVTISTLTGLAGLSIALGAFIAGLLLSESEYRHQIEVDLEPFKGLLLGLFFFTVGTNIDFRIVLSEAGWIALAVAGLILVKAAILFAAARAFRVANAEALEVALLLGQAGEFAFVVLSLARDNDLISRHLAVMAVAVVGVSMMVTPLLGMLARRLAKRMEPADHAVLSAQDDGSHFADHVVIGGFGRVGQTIARLLDSEDVPFVALDLNSKLAAAFRRRGRLVYFGDASRRELLQHAGAATARAFVVTLDEPDAAVRMIKTIRRLRPDALIFARAKDPTHAATLATLGAVEVIPDAVEASLQLGGRVLEALGVPNETVAQRVEAARVETLGALLGGVQAMKAKEG